MTTHTQGPWRIGNQGFNACNIYAGPENQLEYTGIASVYGIPQNTELAEIEGDEQLSKRFATGVANARLIAAAPEMLEQLESVLKCIEIDGNVLGDMAKMRAVIAKAKGEQ